MSDHADKFGTEEPFTAVTDAPVPMTVAQLLRQLGVSHSDETVRKAAVLGWLEENEPNELLLASMENTPI